MHHATLYIGTSLEEVGLPDDFSTPGLDVEHIRVDALTIDAVRLLRSRVLERPLVSPYSTFVIEARSVNFQAQHALLKLLEEPPAHVRIALVVPTRDTLIPTVLSRLYIVTPTPSESTNEVFEAFCKQPCATRLEEIGERTKQKDLTWIDAVMRGAAQYASHHLVEQPHVARAIANAVALYAEGTTATKMLLEEIALSLP